MDRRFLWILILGLVLPLSVTPVWAAEEKDQKQVVRGPAEVTFGQMLLSLGQGASAEVAYQPEQTRLTVKTLAGEAKITTSARNLVFVENVEGKVQVLLTSTGRVIVIEQGKSEIFGRAIVNDPGQIIVTVASSINMSILPPGLASPLGTPPGLSRSEGRPISDSAPFPLRKR
ncbi:MAG: hypothetical protein HYS14_02025 [Candidatus Rokubacteria bacterium]|nr:hypothetical protein [Candidatus Rokubacteria bacterium]